MATSCCAAMAERLTQRQAEVVAAALDYLPARLLPPVACDVFCADPIFAGLHATATTDDGRSYSGTAHACYPEHVRDHRLTVVLPVLETVTTVLHELGHVLHWTLQDRAGGWEKVPRLEPVTEYAATNSHEEFAEAFVAWFYSPQQVEAERYWRGWSRGNDEFFDRLLHA